MTAEPAEHAGSFIVYTPVRKRLTVEVFRSVGTILPKSFQTKRIESKGISTYFAIYISFQVVFKRHTGDIFYYLRI